MKGFSSPETSASRPTPSCWPQLSTICPLLGMAFPGGPWSAPSHPQGRVKGPFPPPHTEQCAKLCGQCPHTPPAGQGQKRRNLPALHPDSQASSFLACTDHSRLKVASRYKNTFTLEIQSRILDNTVRRMQALQRQLWRCWSLLNYCLWTRCVSWSTGQQHPLIRQLI